MRGESRDTPQIQEQQGILGPQGLVLQAQPVKQAKQDILGQQGLVLQAQAVKQEQQEQQDQ